VTTEEQGHRFDENAALAELERLRESIQAARQARQRSSDEFEAFVKSFRKPASKPLAEGAMPTPRAPEAPPQAASESIDRSLHSGDSLPSPVPVVSSTDSVIGTPAVPTSQVAQRYRLSMRSLGILAIVAVIALGLLLTRWGKAVPPASVNTVRNNAAVTPNAAAPPPASQSPPATPASAGVGIELRVIRPVWMRVVVDGRKDVEGTVQAGEPLHFRGDHSIVVRVGNGGDVVVKTGNREESFGDTGQPRTRTFSKP
jgi:uncharacterized protein DUF4115